MFNRTPDWPAFYFHEELASDEIVIEGLKWLLQRGRDDDGVLQHLAEIPAAAEERQGERTDLTDIPPPVEEGSREAADEVAELAGVEQGDAFSAYDGYIVPEESPEPSRSVLAEDAAPPEPEPEPEPRSPMIGWGGRCERPRAPSRVRDLARRPRPRGPQVSDDVPESIEVIREQLHRAVGGVTPELRAEHEEALARQAVPGSPDPRRPERR